MASDNYVDYSIIIISPDGREEIVTGVSSKNPPSLQTAIKLRNSWANELERTHRIKVGISIYTEGIGWSEDFIADTEAIRGKL